MAKVGQFRYPYPRPSLTVDAVVWTLVEGQPRVLLIQRKHDPFAGKWALPGGFVDEGEPLEAATRRELKEETGITVGKLWPLGTYGDPGRDPRGWTVSAVTYAVIPDAAVDLAPGDDAANANWFSIRRLPACAFDHSRILKDAHHRIGIDLFMLPVLQPVLPKTFDAKDLYAVYRGFVPEVPMGELMKQLTINGLIRTKVDSKKDFVFRKR